MANKKGIYPHGNFVADNMSDEGYNKMKEALTDYLSKYHNNETVCMDASKG